MKRDSAEEFLTPIKELTTAPGHVKGRDDLWCDVSTPAFIQVEGTWSICYRFTVIKLRTGTANVLGQLNVKLVVPVAVRPFFESCLPLRSFAIILRHTTLNRTSGRVARPTHRPLRDNTQHSQDTDIYAPGSIRTHNHSKRAPTDPRVRPRSHWNRQ